MKENKLKYVTKFKTLHFSFDCTFRNTHGNFQILFLRRDIDQENDPEGREIAEHLSVYNEYKK
jgi:hypothetical protein